MRLRLPPRALLEKIRREKSHLERVFRRINDADKCICYGFDPVEQHLDDALQDKPDVDPPPPPPGLPSRSRGSAPSSSSSLFYPDSGATRSSPSRSRPLRPLSLIGGGLLSPAPIGRRLRPGRRLAPDPPPSAVPGRPDASSAPCAPDAPTPPRRLVCSGSDRTTAPSPEATA